MSSLSSSHSSIDDSFIRDNLSSSGYRAVSQINAAQDVIRRGSIQIIFGPMFSGKSTELLRRLRRFNIANMNCIALKYKEDVRYDNSGAITTHDRMSLEAIPMSTLSCVKKVLGSEFMKKIDVIGIDEGQFFPDIVSFAEKMANKGKIVIIAALDGTFERNAFGDILNLVPLAESVCKLSSVCSYCHYEASFSKRIGIEKQVQIIGGAERYNAVCRNCFFNKTITVTPSLSK